MSVKELIEKYLAFFCERGHKLIPSASLVPQNDPTILFTTAGMHPLVPYLLGEPHPLGKRLVSLQKCMRTDDIDEVGDSFHHTFFLMLGNWSLGDYFKKEAITWSYQFLTSELMIPGKNIVVSVFAGNNDALRDTESAKIWEEVGIPKEKIYFLPKEDNWWGPAGRTGPCGPDTEMYYDTGKKDCGDKCIPGCQCGKFIEIWNDVFMEYNKKLKVPQIIFKEDFRGKQSEKLKVEEQYYFEPLKQKNVDTGMGVERMMAVLSRTYDDYKTELFWPIIKRIEDVSGKRYEDDKKTFRIMADHLRAAVFIIGDGVEPSNKERGYVLRRLIRRSIFYGKNNLKIENNFVETIGKCIIEIYQTFFPEISSSGDLILTTLKREEDKFLLTIKRGYNEIERHNKLDSKIAFYLYESFGFPLELTTEIAEQRGEKIDREVFKEEFNKHKELSRVSGAARFSGGLADNSNETTALHTATHLLNQALRKILGGNISQKGSNITSERLRFDFNYPNKLTNEQLFKVEDLVNEKIKANLPVEIMVMDYNEAIKAKAYGVFTEKYPPKVKVYTVGDFSKEICGGPHVKFTGQLGKFKIIKEESAGSGIRRIYAKLNKI